MSGIATKENKIKDYYSQTRQHLESGGSQFLHHLRIEVLEEGCEPNYANEGDAGMDCYARETVTVPAGETRLVPLGFKVTLPSHMEMQLRAKSGLAYKNKVTLLNGVGTVDSTFPDEVAAIIINHSNQDYTFEQGKKVCQAVLNTFYRATNLDTVRAERKGGFGSTGLENNKD